MELRDHLHTLGLRLGRGIFDDADRLRTALDDNLDQDAASTDEIDLLVDAVRLGAFGSMLRALDSGAEVSRSVDEAGARLARDRGSADVAGSQWACAVLGFAVERVSQAEVRRHRPEIPSTAPSLAPPSWGGASARKRSPLLILAVVVVVLAVLGGGVVAVVLAARGAPEARRVDVPSETGTTSPDPNDAGAIGERYAALGATVAAGVEGCVAADVESGESERLTCTFADGTLTLVTYDSADALERARTRAVDLEDAYGGVYQTTGSDVVYGFDAAQDASDEIKESSLYWDDDHALQTATLEGGAADVRLADLKGVFDAAGSNLLYPTRPTDGLLIAFINRASKSSTCKRIPTTTVGETEESACDGPKKIKPYYGKFATRAHLDDYRDRRAKDTRASAAKPGTWFKVGARKLVVGVLDRYVIKAGTKKEQAVIYWDDESCLCYGRAYLPGGDEDKLFGWWRQDAQD